LVTICLQSCDIPLSHMSLTGFQQDHVAYGY
jgi:hypothetical protein